MRSLKREFIKRVAARQTRLKRHGKFTPSGAENLRQATRQIYAKWQGKFKPNLAKPKSFF
ncbi:hypothetical protein LXR38_000331 [Campylobacter upsaliensis]|nr:hypothetical protein [Campylobacter upsaliensis]